MIENEEKYFCLEDQIELTKRIYGPYITYICLKCDKSFENVGKYNFQKNTFSKLTIGDLPKNKKDLVEFLKKFKEE